MKYEYRIELRICTHLDRSFQNPHKILRRNFGTVLDRYVVRILREPLKFIGVELLAARIARSPPRHFCVG